MALNATEEAQLRLLIAQQAALLSLASNESTITSKLGATKVTLADLPPAASISDADLLLVRQGSADKSVSKGILALSISAPDASETTKGIVEIATAAEAQAFVANKAIDGAKLSAALQGANQSLTANGFQKLPGGLIVQWGTSPVSSSGTLVSLPIPFPNNFFHVGAGRSTAGGLGSGALLAYKNSLSDFYLDFFDTTTSAGETWLAVGN